ncbi:MAG: 1-deoxy-D-xylulose-5-phosphate synthase [Clostridia bacterium]
MILDNINSPDDLKKLSQNDILALCDEIRQKILGVVSKNGGHLSSNLGVVELTVALHRVFSSPADRIIFDVSHQSYVHKILTGRKDKFDTLRKKNGICGFMSRAESPCDPFGSGHSSNSISAALGMATAAKLNGDNSYTVAIVGDGAFTGGMVYEAINNCSKKKLNLVIILNDNEMSISKNVGAIDNYFARFRLSTRYFDFKHKFVEFFSSVPIIGQGFVDFSRKLKNKFKHLVLRENMFELLGLEYYGPVDGNNEQLLERILYEAVRHKDHIPVIHVCTKKGKGYSFAEEKPDVYHSVSSFDLSTGVVPNGKEKTFSYNFGKILAKKAADNTQICAVTAAMTDGTGLTSFANAYPDRFFDVGIAEQHAATFCAGLSALGKKPVFAVYSTFIQRCFDQILEDCALQNLPVIFAIDRAGIIGDDGATHHGIFDVSLLSQIPKMQIFSPDSISELDECIDRCLSLEAPSAFRYSRGHQEEYDRTKYTKTENLYYMDFGTPHTAVITYGRVSKNVHFAAEKTQNARVIRLLRVCPLPIDEIMPLLIGIDHVIFVEEGIKTGGAAEAFATSLCGMKIRKNYEILAIENEFIPHGDNASLYDDLGFSIEKLVQKLC